jgi:hypothetical protein
MEGRLKAEIIADPERFVVLDEELPATLMDLKQAGKKLLVITNSEWSYTRSMMSHVFDRYLPKGSSWRQLFDVVIVEARKPSFFTARNPIFEVVNEEGLLRPYMGKLAAGGVYLGGHARLIEQDLELLPEEILYVGDHVYADVHVTKHIMRWRTALVLRDIEGELAAIENFNPQQAKLTELMADKERLEHEYSVLRLHVQRGEGDHSSAGSTRTKDSLRRRMQQLRTELSTLDTQIAPLARSASELHSQRWGLLMRAGADKSYLARQIERYADIYTSRVSNFGAYTPFVYLRAPRVSLPHDGTGTGAGEHSS